MAPPHYHQYKGRAINGPVTFTVIFTVLAGLLLISAFVWGFVLPWFRKKYLPPIPSQTKYNQPSRRFHGNESSEPLIQTTSRKRERFQNTGRRSTSVTVYNPRLQTPFPRAPPHTESIALPTYTPSRWYSQNLNASHQFYSPIRDRQSSFPIARLPAPQTLSKARSPSQVAKSSDHDKDFGDAKEYILAVPEPLRVRSRSHGNQLVTSSTLGSLPSVTMSPTSDDKHFHPNKLFAQLNHQAVQENSRVTASLKINDNVDDEQSNHQSLSSQQSEAWPRMSQCAIEPNNQQEESSYHYSTVASEATPAAHDDDDDESTEHNASIAAMHRLGAYRSLVGALPPEPLTRAGTLTRPKTPVAKMRGIYDKTTNGNKSAIRPVSQDGSMTDFLRSVAGNFSSQTAPSSTTSHYEAPADEFSASSLSLLPTPLRINHPVDSMPASVPARRVSRFNEEFDYEGPLTVPHKKITHNEEASITVGNSSPSVPSTNIQTRPRARPLVLPLNESVRQLRQPTTPSHGRSAHAGRAMHIRRPPISSFDPSSIYSRDTRGFSIANTPATSEFPETPSFRAPFSTPLPSTNNDVIDADDEPKHEDSEEEDLIIHSSPGSDEEQEVNTREIVINTSPSSSLKRALSNLGPDCESSHEVSSNEEPNRHSVISTEMTPSEMRLSRVTGAVRISDCTSVATPRNSHDAVREDADWI